MSFPNEQKRGTVGIVRLSALHADPRKLAGDADGGWERRTAPSTQDLGITIHRPRSAGGRLERKPLDCRFASGCLAAWDMPWLTSGQARQRAKGGLPMWRPHSLDSVVYDKSIIHGSADVDVASAAVRSEHSVRLALY